MKKLLILFTFLLTGTFFITSCTKDKHVDSTELTTNDSPSPEFREGEGEGEGEPGISQEDIYKSRKKLAKLISCFLSDERESNLLPVFKRLAIETRESGHPEREFFFNLEKDEPREQLGGQSIAEVLTNYNSNAANLLATICANDPGLTILSLGDESSNNHSTKIYYNDGFDDSDPNASVKYFQNCRRSSTPVNTPPTISTFMIRECETYVSPTDLTSEIHAKTVNDTYIRGGACGNEILLYVPPTFSGNGNGGNTGNGSGGNGGPCSVSCERDCEDGTENLRKFRARSDYDGWNGDSGEFLFYILFSRDLTYEEVDGELVVTGGIFDYVIHRYDEVKGNNEWMYVNGEVIFWDPEDNGDQMKYILYEDDGGNSESIVLDLEYEVSGFTAAISIPFDWNGGDDFIGESIVEYCQDIDPNGFEYHPSNKVDFTLNER